MIVQLIAATKKAHDCLIIEELQIDELKIGPALLDPAHSLLQRPATHS
jgi:hypothetical protein